MDEYTRLICNRLNMIELENYALKVQVRKLKKKIEAFDAQTDQMIEVLNLMFQLASQMDEQITNVNRRVTLHEVSQHEPSRRQSDCREHLYCPE